MNVVLVQLQFVFYLSDFFEVAGHHYARNLSFVVVHLLHNIAALWVQPLKLCVLPWLLTEWQSVLIQGNTLYFKDLVILERYSEVMGLELVDALLDIKLQDVRLDRRNEFTFWLLLRLLLDIESNVLDFLAHLIRLANQLVVLPSEILLKLDKLIRVF